MITTQPAGNLVRKQFLVSQNQINKLTKLASAEGKSVAEIVRLAIDAFDPDGLDTIDAPELMDLVSIRLKDAIQSTKHTNRVVAKTLQKLDAGK